MTEHMSLQRDLVLKPEFREAFQGVPIYGVAGSNGSGKDTLLSLFEAYGYFVFNTGDNLRQITKAAMDTTQRGGNHSPTGMVANAQRSTYPGGMVTLGMIDYWARVLHIPENLRPKGLVIGSIRSVSEAQALKDFGGQLIVVDANPHVRHQRIISRAREYEAKISYEQFIAEDEAEMGKDEKDTTKFGLAQVIEMADTKLDNSGESVEEFVTHARKALNLEDG